MHPQSAVSFKSDTDAHPNDPIWGNYPKKIIQEIERGICTKIFIPLSIIIKPGRNPQGILK